MFNKKLALDKFLFEKAKKYAEAAGYSSVEEFVTHIIEKEIAKIEEDGDSRDAVEKRLRGLGYIS